MAPRRRLVLGFGAVLLGAAVLVPWWRNHALLRDFYDYGLVMAAAGRINLGERPYVDFSTPIQTLQFALAALAERWMGARYLSLTYANGIFIAVTFATFALALARRLGGWGALVVSAAVVVASSGQHTIVWHNAMGVALLAGVTWTMADLSGERRTRRVQWALVIVLLWLGGMTKLTYQVAALAFAVLFGWRAIWRGEISRMEGWLGISAGLFAGTVGSIGMEMAFTGASLRLWVHNVTELARSRTALLEPLVSPAFYLHTPHDYYKPMYFPFVGAWGIAVLAVVGGASAWRLAHSPEKRPGERVFLGVAVGGAIACGVVLLATNLDIAYLSGAAWLVLATGIMLAFLPREPGRPQRFARWLLMMISVTLLVPAWLSAWAGVRSLWGRGPLIRSELVSADDLPERFDYLRGVAITPAWHASLHAFDEYARSLATQGIPAPAYYFVNGAEWMVRALPEARHRGLPLWLHNGTTFSAADVWLLTARLNRGSAFEVVISDDPWDRWFFGMDEFMHEYYQPGRIGPELRVYRRRPEMPESLTHPVDFAVRLKSNLLSTAMTFSGGSVAYWFRPDGGFVGGTQSWRIDDQIALPDVRGEMVAELLPEGVEREVPVVFRVRAQHDGATGRVLAEEKATLTARQPSVVRPFAVSALGTPLAFEVELPPGKLAIAGWRSLRTSGAAEADTALPGPFDPRLPAAAASDHWRGTLFADHPPAISQLTGFSIDIHTEQGAAGPELFLHAPGEVWFKLDGAAKRISGQFGLREASWKNPGSLVGVRVAVVWCNGGRVEILDQRELRPRQEADRAAQVFDVVAPEPHGWIGFVVTTLEGNANAFGHLWWRDVRVR